jgi:hypothetical protein
MHREYWLGRRAACQVQLTGISIDFGRQRGSDKHTEEKRIERGTKRHGTGPLLVRRVVHKQTQSGTTCVVNDLDCAVGAIFLFDSCWVFPTLAEV